MEHVFTKEEAVQYLGEVCLVRSDYTRIVNGKPSDSISAGDVGKIQSIDIWDGQIKVCLDVYGNYFSLDKRQFLNHCVLLKPEIIAHHISDNLSQ